MGIRDSLEFSSLTSSEIEDFESSQLFNLCTIWQEVLQEPPITLPTHDEGRGFNHAESRLAIHLMIF